MRLRPRNTGPFVLVAGSVGVALTLTACSSGSTSSGGGGGGGDAAATGASSCAQSAQAKVTAASQPAKFTAPTAPVDVKALAGKTVFYLAPDLSLPFIKAIADGFSDGAKAAGLKPVIFDGKGNVNTFNQGVTSAVAQKVNGLLLQGVNPSLVSGPLAQLTASKAPVVDSLNGGPDAPDTDGVQAHVTVDYKLGGQLMADNALAQSNCEGDIVFFTSSIYKVYVDMLAGFNSEISTLCPACKAPTVVDVAPTDLATKLPTLTTTNLTRHPSAKVFVAAYDGMVQFISPSIQEASSKVVVIGHDGVDSNLQQIRAGSTPQISTISNPPNAAIGWAEVDQLARLMSGGQAVTEDLPQQIFTKANTAADAASMFPGYADYQSTYKTLWGVN
jgi:ribose transport system substrate-binding protein